MNEAMNWCNSLKELACVRRFSQTVLAKDENVLEHTGMVALLAKQFGEILNSSTPTVDIGELLSKALLHDIEESKTGDVARPLKYSSNALLSEFKFIEGKIASTILAEAGMFSSIKQWQSSKEGIEGKIIKYCDALSAMLKFHDEIVMRGNKSMIALMADDIFISLDNMLTDIYAETNNENVQMIYYKLNRKLEKEICSHI